VSIVPGALLAMVVLAAAGGLPVVALVGTRWFAIPLCPLAGALVAAVAATGSLAIGGTTMTWFIVLGVAAAGTAGLWWWRRPERRPEPGAPISDPPPTSPGHRLTGVVGMVGIVAAGAWCLRTLATPTVGFDARAIWLLRAGWFLQPHHQLLIDMSTPGVLLPQTSYPPLVSAAASVAWWVTGNHSVRMGVVVIALLNVCALTAAALAIVECGRQAGLRLAARVRPADAGAGAGAGNADACNAAGQRRTGEKILLALPGLAGVIGAVTLVFVTFAVTEPFMTNGYADPLWSLAAVGAVAYGLQMSGGRATIGAASILVVVAGLSKQEGAATAFLLIGLLVVRRLVAGRVGRGGSWWRPAVTGLAGVILVGAWPATIRLRHLRNVSSGGAAPHTYLHRAREAVDGLAPYLHVVLLAALVTVVGTLVLLSVRRSTGAGNDAWGWAGWVAGTGVIVGAYATGTADVASWLTTTAHRVTEFPALEAWWLVAFWMVTASAAPAALLLRPRKPATEPVTEPATEPAFRW
jgi:LPXTG-motif cell wall-anchored protein